MLTFDQYLSESVVSDRYHDSLDDDSLAGMLKRYSLNPIHTGDIDKNFKALLSEYGNEKPETVYRGINFSTKEQYDSFMEQLKDSRTIKTDRMTSWTTKKTVAEDFAKHKKAFGEFVSGEVVALYNRQMSENERIMGFRGIVLSMKISKDQGIDMERCAEANVDEAEVIIPKGSYKVEVKEIKTFKDTIAELPDSVNGVLKMCKDGDEFFPVFKYIQTHFAPGDLNTESKKIVAKYLRPDHVVCDVSFRDRKDFDYIEGDEDGKEYSKIIDVRFDAGSVSDLDWLTKEDARNARKAIKSEILGIIKEVKSHYKPDSGIYLKLSNGRYISMMAKEVGLSDAWTDLMREIVGKAYKWLNTQGVKDINSIDDPREKERAIDQYTQKLLGILKNLA